MLALRHLTGTVRFSLVFVALTLGLALWSEPELPDAWRFSRPAFETGAWWQLITSQWVHLSGLHAVVNATGMVLMLVAFHGFVDTRTQLVALLGGYLGVATVLALDTHCNYYAGASGALHGFLAGNAIHMVLGKPGQVATPQTSLLVAHSSQAARVLALIVLLGLIVKLVVQHRPGTPAMPGWLGFSTYYPAHEAGAAGGLIAVVLVSAWRRGASAKGQSHKGQ
ncbi:MAG: hypothetical protein RIS34_1856 [Pseudomonadota bacterium]|jgi:membrane associated rhomboid family serine protease